MAIIKKISPTEAAPKKDRPSLSPIQVQDMTGGALTVSFLKYDRIEADQNGTSPKIPFYKFGYRTIRYRPSDVDAFLDSCYVE